MRTKAPAILTIICVLMILAAVFSFISGNSTQPIFRGNLSDNATYILQDSRILQLDTEHAKDIRIESHQVFTPDKLSSNAARESFVDSAQKANHELLQELEDSRIQNPLTLKIYNIDPLKQDELSPQENPQPPEDNSEPQTEDPKEDAPVEPEGFSLEQTAEAVEEFSLGWNIKNIILNFLYIVLGSGLALGVSRRLMHEKTGKQGLLLFSLPLNPQLHLLRKTGTFTIVSATMVWIIAYVQTQHLLAANSAATLITVMICAGIFSAVCAPNLKTNSILILGFIAAVVYSQLIPPVLFSTEITAQISLLGIIGAKSPSPAAWQLVVPAYFLSAVTCLLIAARQFNAEDFFCSKSAFSNLLNGVGRKISPITFIIFPLAVLPFVALITFNTDVLMSGIVTRFKPSENTTLQLSVLAIKFTLLNCLRLSLPAAIWFNNRKTRTMLLLCAATVSGALFAPAHSFVRLYVSRFYPEIMMGIQASSLWIAIISSVCLSFCGIFVLKIFKPKSFIVPVLIVSCLQVAFHFTRLFGTSAWLAFAE